MTKKNKTLGGGGQSKKLALSVSKGFRPLVATSLALALGVSVAVANPTTTIDSSSNTNITWTTTDNISTTTYETLTFKNGVSSSTSGTNQIIGFTSSAQVDGNGNSLQMGSSGTGTIEFRYANGSNITTSLNLGNITTTTNYALYGNIYVGTGGNANNRFTGDFGGKGVKGNITLDGSNGISTLIFSGSDSEILGNLTLQGNGTKEINMKGNTSSIGIQNTSWWTISSTGGATTINFSNATTENSTNTANSTIYGGIKSTGSGSLTLNANSLTITDHLFSQGNAKNYINTASNLTINGFIRTFKNGSTGGNYIVVDSDMSVNGIDAYDQNPTDSNTQFHSNLLWIGGKLTLTTNNSLNANWGNGFNGNTQTGRPTENWGFKTLSAFGGVTNVVIAGEIDFSAYQNASSQTYLFAKEDGGQNTGQNHLILTDSTKTFNFVSAGNFVADLTVQNGGNGLSLAGTNNIGSETSRVTIYADNSLSSGTGTSTFNRLQFGENSVNTLYLDNLKVYGKIGAGEGGTHNILSFDNTSGESTIDINNLIAESSGQNYIGKNLITFDSSKTTNDNRDTQKKGLLPNTTYFNSSSDKRFSLKSADGIMVEDTKANVAKITVNTELSAKSSGQNYINITGDLDVKAGGLSSAGTNYIIANNISIVGNINANGGTNKTSALGTTTLAGSISASGGGNNSITTNTFSGSATSITANNATNTIHSTGEGNLVITQGISTSTYTNSQKGNTITLANGDLSIGAFNSGNTDGSSLYAWNGGNSNTINLAKDGAILTLGGAITSGGGSQNGNTINFNGTSGILKSSSGDSISASGITNIDATSLTIQDNDSGTGTLTTSGGTTNLTFKDSTDGSLNGNITTTGGTTNLVLKDSQSYSIVGTLSTSGGGKNIIDLTSKSATISTDLNFSGSESISSGAGNIINIGSGKTLTFSDSSGTPSTKQISTTAGATTLNFNGANAGLSGNVSTSGGTTNINFKNTSSITGTLATSDNGTTNIAVTDGMNGTISGAVTAGGEAMNINFLAGSEATTLTLGSSGNGTLSTTAGTTAINFNGSNGVLSGLVNTNGSNAITTITIADNSGGTISGAVSTNTTNGTTNISFASGTNAKSLTLNGNANTITSINLGSESTPTSTNNTLILSTGNTTISTPTSIANNQALTFDLKDGVNLTNNIANAGTTNLEFNGSDGILTGTISTTAGTTTIKIAEGKSGTITGVTSLSGGANNVTIGNGGTLTLQGATNALTSVSSTTSGTLSLDGASNDNGVSASVANAIENNTTTLNFNGASGKKAEMTLASGGNELKAITLGSGAVENKLILSAGSTSIQSALAIAENQALTFSLSGDAELSTSGITTTQGSSTISVSGTNIISGSGNIGITNLVMEAQPSNTASLTFKNAQSTFDTLSTTINDSNSQTYNLTLDNGSTLLKFGTTNGEATLNEVTFSGTGQTLEFAGGETTISAITTSTDSTLKLSSGTGETNSPLNNTRVKVNNSGSNLKVAFEGGKANDQLHHSTLVLTNSSNTLESVVSNAKNAVISLSDSAGATITSTTIQTNSSLTFAFTGSGTSNIVLTGGVSVGSGSTFGISLGGSDEKTITGDITFAEHSTLLIDFQNGNTANATISTKNSGDSSANTNGITIGTNRNSIINFHGSNSGQLNGSGIVIDGGNSEINFIGTATMDGVTLTSGINTFNVYGSEDSESAITGTIKDASANLGGIENTINLADYAILKIGEGGSSSLTTNSSNTINFNGIEGTIQGGLITNANASTTLNFGSDINDDSGSITATITGTITNSDDTQEQYNGGENLFNIKAKNVTFKNGDSGLVFANGLNIINFKNISTNGATLTWQDNTQAIKTTGGNTEINFTNSGTISGGVSTSGGITQINIENSKIANISALNTSDKGATFINFNGNTGTLKSAITTSGGKTTLELTDGQTATITGSMTTSGGITEISFAGVSKLSISGDISTTDSGTTNINIADNTYGVINGEINQIKTNGYALKGISPRGVETTTTNTGTNVKFTGSSGALILTGQSNSISNVTLGDGNYALSLTEATSKGGEESRSTRRSLTIDTLDTGSGSGSFILGTQATATEADTFVINAATGSKQGTYHFGIVLDKDTQMQDVGVQNGVKLASVATSAGIDFELKSKVIQDFTTGDAEINTITSNGYTSYYIGKIDNLEVIAAEQEITATAFTLNYDLYMANLNSLNKRMGELRENNH
ncbi:S-layer family protein, partial [Helicobacter brantae]